MSCSLTGSFIGICKKAFVPVVNANDDLPIDNYGALRLGLEALQKEDAGDFARAAEMWQMAQKILTDESENETGPGSEGVIQVNDDFDLANMSDNPCYWY